ncbi:MAG: GNAT family N-acetyltransferase [Christensenellaceae bacterium]|jgi:RimJ/RimL family protein N-acetyltransferase
MKEIFLRPLEDSDIPQLTEWLNKDYIKKWYHDPEAWLQEIHERRGRFSWLHHFIVLAETVPIGFCQYYDCCDANGLEDWYRIKKRGDTFSIDYLIGEERYLGKGYGKTIVRLLTETLRDTERARKIIVQPDGENAASNGVLLANSYTFDESAGYYQKSL